MSKAQTKLFNKQLSNALDRLETLFTQKHGITEEQISTAFPVSGLWNQAEKQPVKTGETYGALFPEFFG